MGLLRLRLRQPGPQRHKSRLARAAAMYNGIGIQTPKGSGTNGHVQRNLAHVRNQRLDIKEFNKGFGAFKAEPIKEFKKANPELLLHEQKRKVEIDLIKLEDELRTAGMGDKEIEENLSREREQMMRAVEDGSLRYDSQLEKKDSHQMAVEKERELARFEKALRIEKGSHVMGQAFDQDLQEKLKLDRMAQRAEQEQAKLEAAKKAEKAQKKAEKLREKAEKAKKKAEEKLKKLKEKQEKKRLKKEQKEKTKVEPDEDGDKKAKDKKDKKAKTKT